MKKTDNDIEEIKDINTDTSEASDPGDNSDTASSPDVVPDNNDTDNDDIPEEKGSSDKSAKGSVPEKDEASLAKNKRAVIFEICLAVAAIIIIVVAIVIKQKTPAPDAATADTESGNEMVQIDNSVLFEGVPAIPP
ncbi:MAG: hypothetical protein J6X66_05820, partial [Lachnospiraceae bacterium]|nr:hypothetical protein [Lachnospiraceae bacterium]